VICLIVFGEPQRGDLGPLEGGGELLSHNNSHEVCGDINTCRNYSEICWKKIIVKNPILKPGVDVRMILKWIVKTEDGKLQIKFI